MNCSVNLVPASCRTQSLRAARRRWWSGVLLIALVLLVGGSYTVDVGKRARGSVEAKLQHASSTKVDTERRIAMALQARNAWLARARTLAAIQQDQVFASRLLALSSIVPEGVVFTEIRGTEQQPPTEARPRPITSAVETTPSEIEQLEAWMAVTLRGFAIDQRTLGVFLQRARQAQGWSAIELARSTRQKYRAGTAIAFELTGAYTEKSR